MCHIRIGDVFLLEGSHVDRERVNIRDTWNSFKGLMMVTDNRRGGLIDDEAAAVVVQIINLSKHRQQQQLSGGFIGAVDFVASRIIMEEEEEYNGSGFVSRQEVEVSAAMAQVQKLDCNGCVSWKVETVK